MAKSLHVLVAEDNPINQRLATAVLAGLGHTGVVVPDGEQALRAVAQFAFDVVLMDVQMPNLDGLAALAALRARERAGGTRLCVIMATSHDLPGDRERLLQAGADGYVAKPLNSAALQAELNRVVRR